MWKYGEGIIMNFEIWGTCIKCGAENVPLNWYGHCDNCSRTFGKPITYDYNLEEEHAFKTSLWTKKAGIE